jgi:SAM-dependent methyltransferase
VVDRLFSDPVLAGLYDTLFPGREDIEFYLPLLMSSQSVLDVGCGTGSLLHDARAKGHAGRLCGLDPAEAMLAQARKRSDIEWVRGDLTSVRWEGEFDLVVMTGHAFQVFVEDEEIRASLAAIHAALLPNGRFAFETRNPKARAWEGWTPDQAVEVEAAGGIRVQMAHELGVPFDGRTLTFTTTFRCAAWDGPRISHSTLRFLDPGVLSRFLRDAGFAIEAQWGNWNREPLMETSPEIITIARRGE